jgi:YggT family protein
VIESILLLLLTLFKWALFLRVIIDYVRMFARNWRPSPIVLAIFEGIYAITDRPMRFVQQFIPPLRLGGIAIDLSFIVLLIAVNIAQTLVVIIF